MWSRSPDTPKATPPCAARPPSCCSGCGDGDHSMPWRCSVIETPLNGSARSPPSERSFDLAFSASSVPFLGRDTPRTTSDAEVLLPTRVRRVGDVGRWLTPLVVKAVGDLGDLLDRVDRGLLELQHRSIVDTTAGPEFEDLDALGTGPVLVGHPVGHEEAIPG